MWLKDGRVECYGPAEEVCSQYLAYHDRKSANMGRPMGTSDARAAAAAGYYAIKSVSMTPGDNVHQYANLTVSGEVYSPDGRVPVVLVGIVRTDGTPVYGVSTDMDAAPPVAVSADLYVFEICFSQLPLCRVSTSFVRTCSIRRSSDVRHGREHTRSHRGNAETGLAHIRHYWGVKPGPKATSEQRIGIQH
jgi:lipopolysaccharide transport system ATP-binding protein